MRAVGFPGIAENILQKLIWNSVVSPENVTASLELEGDGILLEYRMPFGQYVGICAAVFYTSDGFELKYAYPYFDSNEITLRDDLMFERYAMTDTYAAIAEGADKDLSLVFFLNNPVTYRRFPDAGEELDTRYCEIALTAFANFGTVLLPVANPDSFSFDPIGESVNLADLLLNMGAGDSGDFPVDEFAKFGELTSRIEHEDVYSVVEQTLMPWGVEADTYTVVGEILKVESDYNKASDQELWLIKLLCNDFVFWLCIRRSDLEGEPMEGRRLKCRLWMQGNVRFVR